MTSPDIALRKTPRQNRSAVTVATILEAAAHILDTQGLEGFNTNAVARRAGVSIGSLYQYFPGKDALTAALIRHDHDVLLDSLDAAVERTRGASRDEGLAALAKVAVDHQFLRPRLARVLDVEELRLPVSEESAAVMRAIGGKVIGFLISHAPELSATRAAIAAGDLLAIARGLVDSAAQSANPDRPDIAVRVTWALAGYVDRMIEGA